ncbi:MAG: EAL domain-containing protein [Burkholderiaceae bacterium]|nr:EAL domain-containing protein [Burkholderiaceae bacterium]
MATTPISAVARAALIAGLALLFCLLAQLVSAGLGNALLIWPASGVAFAFGWRYGRGWAAAASLGVFAWAMFTSRDLLFSLTVSLASVIGPIVAIHFLRRMADWKPPEYRLDAVVRFLAVALLGSSVVSAAIVTAVFAGGPLSPPVALQPGAAAGPGGFLSLGGLDTASLHPAHVFLSAWLIDGLGMMLVAPALLAWIDDAVPESDSGQQSVDIFDLSSVLMTLLVAATSLTLASWEQEQFSYVVLFAFFPILAWSAVRMSERANALTMLISALPLLAAWAYQVNDSGVPAYGRAIHVSVIAVCAVLVGLVLQSIAADRRLAIQRVARQSRQDMSTGLLNDRGLLAELGDRLVAPSRGNYGLIGLNVTNFDAINDLCGTIDAIQLEQSTAQLLQRVPQLQFAARLSAGRYALVIAADTVAQVRAVAREIYSQLNGQVFQTELGSLRLQCCVGGLLLERHTLISSEDCLFSLGDAISIAASVRDPQLFVEPLSQMMIDARRAHQSKIEHIREAIRDNRIELYAQPVVDPDAPAQMRSYELLTRLRDRDGALIQPPEFLTLASQAQMSIPLDRAVIHRAFEWLAANPEALLATWKCSINLAGATMCDGAIADYIRDQRNRYGIPAQKVVFEITESEAIRNPAAASRLVDDLKEQGFGIALDDFGTGLATFEYLKRFPLDYLKIDGSFIRNLMTNPIDEEIVLSTVRVAARLKLRTVAEHVHSAAVYERLTEMGVTFLQGDFFGKPIPLRDFFALDLKDHAGTEASSSRSLAE